VEERLYDPGHATERITAAVEAARGQPFPFTLTARAENHLHGVDDLADTIARLQAFEAAGADVLYAPWLRTTDQIAAVCAAVSHPVNVLATPGLSFAEIAGAGATRISVGARLTWAAVEAAESAARQLLDGDLSGLRSSPPLDDWFG
jgi:2-methylisocitrate lyase-like PEP mutase family enzyme